MPIPLISAGVMVIRPSHLGLLADSETQDLSGRFSSARTTELEICRQNAWTRPRLLESRVSHVPTPAITARRMTSFQLIFIVPILRSRPSRGELPGNFQCCAVQHTLA